MNEAFLEWQFFPVKISIIYQDNTSILNMEENGRENSGKWTRHFEIEYLYMTYLVLLKKVNIEYCLIDEMIADYMTKPLVRESLSFSTILLRISEVIITALDIRSVLDEIFRDQLEI